MGTTKLLANSDRFADDSVNSRDLIDLAMLDLDKPTVTHPNITRLQVYGWPDMKAVRVSVDTSKRWVFGFEPLYAEESVSRSSARK